MLIASSRTPAAPIQVDLTCDAPLVTHQKLGGTPQDYFDQNPAVVHPGTISCADGACATLPQEVWRDTVVLGADGRPVMQSRTVHLEEKPHSPLVRGLAWGVPVALGAALAGALLGGPGVALAAAGIGGALAGGVAARSAWGDRVRLTWDTHPMESTRLQGYQERVEAGTLWGNKGFYHRFDPVIETQPLGSWKSPRIEHYKEPGQ